MTSQRHDVSALQVPPRSGTRDVLRLAVAQALAGAN